METFLKFFNCLLSRCGFFSRGLTIDVFKFSGISPCCSEVLMMVAIAGTSAVEQDFTSQVGIGSRQHVFEGAFLIIFSTSMRDSDEYSLRCLDAGGTSGRLTDVQSSTRMLSLMSCTFLVKNVANSSARLVSQCVVGGGGAVAGFNNLFIAENKAFWSDPHFSIMFL